MPRSGSQKPAWGHQKCPRTFRISVLSDAAVLGKGNLGSGVSPGPVFGLVQLKVLG